MIYIRSIRLKIKYNSLKRIKGRKEKMNGGRKNKWKDNMKTLKRKICDGGDIKF